MVLYEGQGQGIAEDVEVLVREIDTVVVWDIAQKVQWPDICQSS